VAVTRSQRRMDPSAVGLPSHAPSLRAPLGSLHRPPSPGRDEVVAAILQPLRRRASTALPRAPAQIPRGLDSLPVDKAPFPGVDEEKRWRSCRSCNVDRANESQQRRIPSGGAARGAGVLPLVASLRLRGVGSRVAGGAGDGQWQRREETRGERRD
jgi:hypothetical protein